MKLKLKVVAGAFASVLLIAGCSSDKEKADETEKVEVTPVEQEADKDKEKDTAASEVKENEDLTKKVLDEKGVSGGRIYEQDGTAIGVLMIDKEVSDADAKALAERYADEIKKEYKDLRVNVQAVRDGENIANITLD